MESFSADSANWRPNLEALVNIANGGRPADMADVLERSRRAANDGYALPRADGHALDVEKLRGFGNISDVADGAKTLGSTTLIGDSEAGGDIDWRLVDMEESHPPVRDMVAGAGSAYALAERFENYPTGIDNRDLNQDNVSADHERRKEKAEQAKVFAQGDRSSSYKRTAQSPSRWVAGKSSRHCRTTSPANGIPTLDA
ncbi:hypothetical protein EPUS_06006 [Endocarpon pusillum Z07020]|uniref:Uncharacterized protein n=1 Tax=Endocarpon pusillum (strain Z07020 / HMAS-L-300199) TaxID=1263415 RepID=U1G1R0_ENDPU|nr:uncharacterized protein EPUS_06006 [Endocarpon pusillum Z07020]ERF71177.1 hypothetical protein EPUS_06006 [Endocarpon pusillum Z07020]